MPIPPPDDGNFNFWQTLGFSVAALFGWTSGRIWKARGMLADLQKKDVELQSALETHKQDTTAAVTAINVRIGSVEAASAACRSDLKTVIRDVVQQVIGNESLKQVEVLASLRTDYAVLVNNMEHMQEALVSINSHMDSRQRDLEHLRQSISTITGILDKRHANNAYLGEDKRRA